MSEQEKREKVISNVLSVVADMQEEVDEWKDYSDSELNHGLTCDCDWWYKTLQTLKDALALLKAQEPRTAEVKWQERHRKSYRQYTGFDAMGDEHTVTVCEESEGREPYCGKCSAQLAESFINYCPRCGVKLIVSSPTDAQRRETPWQ